ncbi:MAG TPA: type VI secretion system baseplate subunit TssE [Pyrinomonadaceae bacterium]|jgi:type VI secretion system lysozyme-like protein|nr:type VI secretion system baseplate subunit TssE [Pyrinomonadaceae bacterium]
MRDPKKVEGGRALLFERLAGGDPPAEGGGARPFRVHETAALKESVRRELVRLLNTRSSAGLDARGGEMSVLDYGVPDFTALSALSGDDRARLSAAVAQSVAAFEPRLRGARVSVEGLRSNDRALVLRLDALLVVGDHAEPVSFPLLVRAGEVSVSEEEAE